MNTLRFIVKKILYPGCAVFTVLWIAVCGIIDAVSDTVNINFASGLMCLFIGVSIALCNLILEKEKLSPIGRYFLHMLGSVFSISIIIALFSTVFKTKYALTANSFYLVLILIVCYLLIATPLIALYFRRSAKINKTEKSEQDNYHSMFRK